MSKVIKLTPQIIEECKRAFEQSLKDAKMTDGKVTFSKAFDNTKEKATVFFEEAAWYKMQALISDFSKEVAWHGVAHRGNNTDKNEYYITDILVYPQEVSGTTVDMDVKEYDKWIRDNFEDERFFNIAMQGHSHVNMGVSPSGTDLSHQQIILDQLNGDMFYIFVIWNKKGESNIRIFDLAKNTLFETEDVTVEVLDGDMGIKGFIEEAKSLVKEKTYSYNYNYNGYWNNQNTVHTPKNEDKKEEPKGENKKEDSKDEKKSSIVPLSSKSKKKKGKRKKNKNKKSKTNSFNYSDDYDPAFYYWGN